MVPGGRAGARIVGGRSAREAVKPEGLRERGKQQRIARILDAGLELLREGSGSAVTMERVAARAEVAPMTVFNLIGNRDQLWSAMADRALEPLVLGSIQGGEPLDRAHRIVDAVVRILRSDSAAFRQLLMGWSYSGRALTHDPTHALMGCLRDAADQGHPSSSANVRRHGEVMAAGLMGVIHQWASGLIGDRTFAVRAHAVVDVVFTAAVPR